MNTIKHIFSRYAALLLAVLKPLGVWGVFAIGAIDAAALGLPVDLVVGTYVYQDRARFLLYVFMASAGETVGSIVIYLIGHLGGEKILRKRISEERFTKIHASFERNKFWALMFPAMLPPPTPFKLFMLAASIFEMEFWHYLLAIFLGRCVRFLVVALLTLKFGPEFVHLVGPLLRDHWGWVLVGIAAVLGLWLVIKKVRENKTTVET